MKLYTFKICPFVEQVKIVLNFHKIDCEQVFVNIRDKPKWFLTISPQGQVPLLEVESETGLKTYIPEARIICEYLDNISQQILYAESPLQKSYQQVWMHKANTLIWDTYKMSIAQNYEEYAAFEERVHTQLNQLENELNQTFLPRLINFSMIDATYAPLLKRFDCLDRIFHINLLVHYPKITQWKRQLLNVDCIKNSFTENFDDAFIELLKLKKSIIINEK